MPTPVGHVLAGLAVAGASRSTGRVLSRATLTLGLLAAAPDLDLTLRLLDGINHHRGPSHSLGAAFLVALAVWALRRGGVRWLPGGVVSGGAWASHVVLDSFGLDTTPPIGLMALWPVSDRFFASPIAIFYDVPRSFSPEAIRHNLVAVLIEMLIMGPLAWMAWRRRSGATGEG